MRRNTCFHRFKSSLAVKFHVPKPERLALSKMPLQSFVFQKVLISQRPLANQLGGFQYNFRCLKRFFRKMRRKLRLTFVFKLRFVKIRLLITWLKCLVRPLPCPFWATLSKICRTWISPLEIYPRPKKQRLIFLKKQKILLPVMKKNTFECWS